MILTLNLTLFGLAFLKVQYSTFLVFVSSSCLCLLLRGLSFFSLMCRWHKFLSDVLLLLTMTPRVLYSMSIMPSHNNFSLVLYKSTMTKLKHFLLCCCYVVVVMSSYDYARWELSLKTRTALSSLTLNVSTTSNLFQQFSLFQGLH